MDDDRHDFDDYQPPEKDPLQFYNVFMIVLGWTAIAALSAYIILK